MRVKAGPAFSVILLQNGHLPSVSWLWASVAALALVPLLHRLVLSWRRNAPTGPLSCTHLTFLSSIIPPSILPKVRPKIRQRADHCFGGGAFSERKGPNFFSKQKISFDPGAQGRLRRGVPIPPGWTITDPTRLKSVKVPSKVIISVFKSNVEAQVTETDVVGTSQIEFTARPKDGEPWRIKGGIIWWACGVCGRG